MIAFCPVCEVERADYEGPGLHLPTCPNCGTHEDPARLAWPLPMREIPWRFGQR